MCFHSFNSMVRVAAGAGLGQLGGRGNWLIKIIKTAGKTLEQTLIDKDPFNGNAFRDKKCLPNKNSKNKIN